MTAPGRLHVARAALAIAAAGCARAGRPPVIPAIPAIPEIPVSAAPPTQAGCIVADSGSALHDTVYVIGGMIAHIGARAANPGCSALLAADAPSPSVTFLRPQTGTDLRDVLDRGLPALQAPPPDVVVTRDPDVIAYAARNAKYRVIELPWNATWVLAIATADSVPPLPTPAERGALARDAVKADARGAAGPFEWDANAACTLSIPAPSSPARPLVAYAADDAIGRQLAERIVALAAAETPPAWIPPVLQRAPLRTAAIQSESVAAVLGDGRATAMVLEIPRDHDGPCGSVFGWPVPQRAIPLVDARPHALLRRGSGVRFVVAADGSLRFLKLSAR